MGNAVRGNRVFRDLSTDEIAKHKLFRAKHSSRQAASVRVLLLAPGVGNHQVGLELLPLEFGLTMFLFKVN